MPLDTTSITGDGALGTCPRCFGKVFAAEKMVAASGYYHRHCFRCVLCSQPLDSTSVCDGPDNKIYCRSVRPGPVLVLTNLIQDLLQETPRQLQAQVFRRGQCGDPYK